MRGVGEGEELGALAVAPFREPFRSGGKIVALAPRWGGDADGLVREFGASAEESAVTS